MSTKVKNIVDPATGLEAELELERKLFVSNIPADAKIADLEKFFGLVGKVEKVVVINRSDASSYGFITFNELTRMVAAVKKLNQNQFQGVNLKVEFAKPKSELHGKNSRYNSQKQNHHNPGTSTRGRGSKPKYRSHPKNDFTREEPNILDIVNQGPPPALKGRRFPLPHNAFRIVGETSSTSIFVGNLPTDMDDLQLAEVFPKYKVVKAWVVRREFNGHSKGFGFVDLVDHNEQKRLLNSAVNGRIHFDGRALNVRPAILPNANYTKDQSVAPPSTNSTQLWPSLPNQDPSELPGVKKITSELVQLDIKSTAVPQDEIKTEVEASTEPEIKPTESVEQSKPIEDELEKPQVVAEVSN